MTRTKKTAAKTAGAKLVRQDHGGALLPGGKPGNRGGPGALPSEVRARLRGSASERIGILEQIIDDPDSSNADVLRAIDIAFKYGLGAAEEDKQVDLGQMHLSALIAASKDRRATPPTLAPTTAPTATARILPEED